MATYDADSVPEGTYTDSFYNLKRVSVLKPGNGNKLEINGLLDGKAWVQVRDVYPSEVPEGWTSEVAAVMCARTSYNMDIRTPKIDAKLISFLAENGHTSPLESCHMRFRLHVPKFVSLQILRHRTASFNELSQRYTKVPVEYYSPSYNNGEGVRYSGTLNKQSSKASEEPISENVKTKLKLMDSHINSIFDIYNTLINEDGVAKEVARYALPCSTYTTLEVQFNLNNLTKFLSLRCAPDCQKETRDIADAMFTLAKQFFPTILSVWEKKQSSITLSREEISGIVNNKCPDTIKSKTAKSQFAKKLKLFTDTNEDLIDKVETKTDSDKLLLDASKLELNLDNINFSKTPNVKRKCLFDASGDLEQDIHSKKKVYRLKKSFV